MPRTADTEYFLKRLGELGNSAGNITLRNKLQWTVEKYFKVRKILIQEGLVDIGRGKGGSVYLLASTQGEEETPEEECQERKHEGDYYPIVLLKIERELKQDFDSAVVALTAYQGKKLTGKWSRPDIMALTVRRFEYVVRDDIALHSYEIKLSDRVDVDAVAEAAAHQRVAQLAYLVIVLHNNDHAIFDPENIKRRNIEKECVRSGVGLILISDNHKDSYIEIDLEASRSNIDDKKINTTIGLLFPENEREEIRKIVGDLRHA